MEWRTRCKTVGPSWSYQRSIYKVEPYLYFRCHYIPKFKITSILSSYSPLCYLLLRRRVSCNLPTPFCCTTSVVRYSILSQPNLFMATATFIYQIRRHAVFDLMLDSPEDRRITHLTEETRLPAQREALTVRSYTASMQ